MPYRASALWLCCSATSASLTFDTIRSRCHSALLGSCAASFSADGELVLVGLERRLQIAPRALHVADLVEADREVALPLGVARVLRGQLLARWRARPGRPCSAASRLPRALCTSPILLKLTERSRCQLGVARGPARPRVLAGR